MAEISKENRQLQVMLNAAEYRANIKEVPARHSITTTRMEQRISKFLCRQKKRVKRSA